jgi:hypothetical protein
VVTSNQILASGHQGMHDLQTSSSGADPPIWYVSDPAEETPPLLRPLIVVPGLFATEIYDDDLGFLWGPFKCMYAGPPIGELSGLRGRPRNVVRGFPVIPRLYTYDLLGALEKALVRAGYQLGTTLHFFGYDWRQRVLDVGVQLAQEVRRLADAHGGPVDMLGLSNGALVIRAAYVADRDPPVERVVTSGGPHAGSVETISCLDRGYQFAPLGRTVSPEQFMACPGALEAAPKPGSVRFLAGDAHEASAAAMDLYDVAAWSKLHMSVFRRDSDDATWTSVMTKRLSDARETWRTLDGAAAPRHLYCICGTGLRTQIAIPVRDGRAWLPGEGNLAGLPPDALGDGDGALTVEGASAWTGAAPEVIRIKVTRHRDTVRTPIAFNAILGALR